MKIVEVQFTRDGAKIVTFIRNQYNELEKEVHDFTHYFYIPDDNGEHKTLFGKPVRKRNVKKFWLSKQIQKEYDEVFEGDISFTKRFMVDKAHELVSPGEPRVLMFDIETTSFTPRDGEILSIVAYDSYARKYYELMWHPDLECDTERKLLIEFAKVIKNVDPDIITGWNSDRFDIPFLYERMEALQVPTELLSRLGQPIKPYHNGERMEYRIRGRINIDYLKAYKKMVIKEMDSYSLEYVAQKELGAGKIDIDKLPGQLWKEKRFDELLRYNRRDVEIMAELDKKLEIIKFLDSMADLASIDFHDTLFNSRIVDSYILRYTSSKGIVLPTRKYTNKSRGYTGAKVLDPIKGIHDNVGIFDLASLYPSIIITFNLSPETMQTEHGIRNEKGLVPILLEDLFVLRREFRDQGKDREQKVVKTIMNSFYGVMALPTFRLYTHAMASEITKHGREIIEHTKNVVKEHELTVVYGDTDSVFVAGIDSKSDAELLEQSINRRYDDYAASHNLESHRLKIEFEGYASRALFVKKKRYAMKLDDGKYKIAGFQLKRSDTQPLARDLQEKILHMILEGAKAKDIYQWFIDIKNGTLKGAYDTKIGIPRKFVKELSEYTNNYAVNGAEYSNKYLNKHFGAGDKVFVYHIDRVTTAKPTRSIALEFDEDIPDEFLIDRKKHWSRIEKAVMPLLLDADCVEKTKQKTLGDFL
jgi:DNA polymerase, archaea type